MSPREQLARALFEAYHDKYADHMVGSGLDWNTRAWQSVADFVLADRLATARRVRDEILMLDSAALTAVTPRTQGRNWRAFNTAWNYGVADYRAAIVALDLAALLEQP